MSYPQPPQAQINFFHIHGYLVVKDAIDMAEVNYWYGQYLAPPWTVSWNISGQSM